MGTTSRFTSGVGTVPKRHLLGMLGVPNPLAHHIFFDDFDRYVVGDWTITTTEAGAGSATEALADGDGGLLLITNDAADNDADFFQKVGESFKFEAGKKLWFGCRFKVSDATQSDVVFGLQITDTTPLAVSDGVYFQKDDGDANIDFHVVKNSTATDVTALGTLADDTFVELGFYYNGSDRIEYWKDGARIGTAATTNLVDDEDLTISFGIQNGEAVAKTMTVDYVIAIKER